MCTVFNLVLTDCVLSTRVFTFVVHFTPPKLTMFSTSDMSKHPGTREKTQEIQKNAFKVRSRPSEAPFAIVLLIRLSVRTKQIE